MVLVFDDRRFNMCARKLTYAHKKMFPHFGKGSGMYICPQCGDYHSTHNLSPVPLKLHPMRPHV
jgi:hypothetical protein